MKNFTFRTFLMLSLAVSIFAASASGQGIGTAEYEMDYGRRAFQAGKYDVATTYFQSAIDLSPNHAEAHFLMGIAYTKLKEFDRARPFLEKAARLNPKYKEEVEEMFEEMTSGDDEEELETSSKRISKDPNTGEEINEYEVGDAVEVFSGGKWNQGKIVEIEGRGKSVFAKVEYQFNGDISVDKFFYKSIRPSTKPVSPAKSDKGNSSGGLVLGTYGCSSKVWSGGQWAFTPRGSFTLSANGKYNQTRGGGSYKYNAGTKEIIFTGGFFGNSKAKGKVINGDHIDIEFQTETPYWWTCSRQ